MPPLYSQLLFLFALSLLPFTQASASVNLETLSTDELEQRAASIRIELGNLAQFRFRSGVGATGFRSDYFTEPRQQQWLQVELREPALIDQIIIVPSITRDKVNGFRANGFPKEFRLFAVPPEGGDEILLATVEETDEQLISIAPRVISIPPTMASWVRIETVELSRNTFDNNYYLELSEFMVFSGRENVALRKPVSSLTPEMSTAPHRQPRFAVDGDLPYLMDGAKSESSIAMITPTSSDQVNTITIDLERSCTVDSIRLHSVELSDTVPQGFAKNLGTPEKIQVEGADKEDFSDATLLLVDDYSSIHECGPIIHRALNKTQCRYIKVTELEPNAYETHGTQKAMFGFAEIEIFADGVNVAKHKPVSANFEIRNPIRSFTTLTDGLNYYGNILPPLAWMQQLARREQLETELVTIESLLKARYAGQKRNLALIAWLLPVAAFCIIIAFLLYRITHQRQIAHIRERFAADLHDELGANIHAIGLLGDLAKNMLNEPEQLSETVDEIRATTERTGQSIRHCTDMQQGILSAHLVNDMRRVAKSILIGIDYTFEVDGEDALELLAARRRVDLYLFFKESLVNISRHADATRCEIKLESTNKGIQLSIKDNGCGLSGSFSDGLPKSLKRRARLLKATVTVKSDSATGTHILLQVRPSISIFNRT
ncbi:MULTISPECIES: sensor histidine kinase [unclassified Lentimonas]|uniref:sensor histidine kinase n=1 Tax=unclassified Lentimonas TaxID=2630993 RepID=UPI001327AE8A|nr:MULTISPECIES: histidine kinase [unclassified Lentimonas]CAA6676243.1 Unannotated [Lentimonas sp. CC4]CAA6683871.1 Unannotated [Lentimonas sp. CC6]CAA7077733.1 Unannotated [Lentimonas sp. CC4]CAA7171897.1 Unannotated [Lentimonas sp. CC21]CAA7183541.1 Unannotated [Lentimonas sp. CC8]